MGEGETKETRLAGWTDVKVGLSLPDLGARGKPLLVTDEGATIQPGPVHIEFVGDHYLDKNSPGGGYGTWGRGSSHFVGEVKGLSFCRGWGPLKTCFNVFGLSHNSKNSQFQFDGQYTGILGSFKTVFGGRDPQPLPGLICKKDPGGDFSRFVAQVNNPPVRTNLTTAVEAAKEGLNWLRAGAHLCTPAGFEVDLPQDSLSLVTDARVQSYTAVEAFAGTKARIPLHNGGEVIVLPGRNFGMVDYQLVREGNTVKGYVAAPVDIHLGGYQAPQSQPPPYAADGPSWTGDVRIQGNAVGAFRPIKTWQDLVSFLMQRPISLLEKLYQDTEVTVNGELKLFSRQDDRITLKAGTTPSVLRTHSTIVGGEEDNAQGSTKILNSCWDFGGIEISTLGQEIPGVFKGCFEGDVHTTTTWDGYRPALVEIELEGKATNLNMPVPTNYDPSSNKPFSFQQINFSGKMQGKIFLVNTQPDPLALLPQWELARGTKLHMSEGNLSLIKEVEKNNLMISAPSGLVFDFTESEWGTVEFHMDFDQPLTTNKFKLSLPDGTRLALTNANGDPVMWKSINVDGHIIQYIPSQQVGNFLLQTVIAFASKAAPQEGSLIAAGHHEAGWYWEPPKGEDKKPLPIYNTFLGSLWKTLLPGEELQETEPKEPAPQPQNNNESSGDF